MMTLEELGNNWFTGSFDNTYLSLNQFISIESSYYRVSIYNTSYRMVVNKYNKDYENVGYSDLCHGDILHTDDLVKYITISIYKYENRQIVDNYNRELLSELSKSPLFSISKIENLSEITKEQELLTSEIHKESLSNVCNYRNGWYKSWGGKYEELTGRLCNRNLYKVDNMPYVFNVNDSRITISIGEFNAEGKWVKYIESMQNGDVFQKQSKTEYIGITVRSRKWGVDLYDVFNQGLELDFSNNAYVPKTELISVSQAKFYDPEQWRTGGFLLETGDIILDASKIAYKFYCKVDEDDYVVNLPGGYLRMNILELDASGKSIVSNALQSGQKWRKSSNTDKIAITVTSSGITLSFDDYKRLIAEYPKFGLEKYTIYQHNTNMKDMTADQFMNAVAIGWNLGNSLDTKSTKSSETANLNQELRWGNPYVSKDLIDYVAKCGFQMIRIPVTWCYNTYKDENDSLRINKAWLNRVQDVVNYAIANGLYVILNTHHEQPIIYAGTSEDSMKQVLKDAKAIWTDIAECFKTYDEHLLFESFNEVDNIEKSWTYSDKAAAQMNELNQSFVDTVRGTGDNNAKRILIVPTLLDKADSRFYSSFRKPKDMVENKIIIQLHSYSQRFNQDIESSFSEMQEFSNKVKAPLIIGEFGTTPTFTIPELRAEHASNFVARAAKYGIKCIWWDNGSEYKIIDRRDYSKSDIRMIGALIEGSQGVAYELEDGMVFDKIEQFVYRTPNIKTGKLENTYWGTLTTDDQGGGIGLQEGTRCTLSLKSRDEAASVWLQRLLFYDASGVLVQNGKEIQSKYLIYKIPEGAATMRVSMNSPNINISQANYMKYFMEDKLELVIRCFKASDLKRITLDI